MRTLKRVTSFPPQRAAIAQMSSIIWMGGICTISEFPFLLRVHRLTLEALDTDFSRFLGSSSDYTILRGIYALAEFGCRIDIVCLKSCFLFRFISPSYRKPINLHLRETSFYDTSPFGRIRRWSMINERRGAWGDESRDNIGVTATNTIQLNISGISWRLHYLTLHSP
jgi:hypothetical protein